MATQEEKQQHQREARALLEGFWPEGFSFSAPKPLKIGITDDLVADAERRGLPFTREEIKAAVRLFMRRVMATFWRCRRVLKGSA